MAKIGEPPIKEVADLLRFLVDSIENDPSKVVLNLEAKIYPTVTGKKLLERDEAMRAGYVIDITSPRSIEVHIDGRKVGGPGWPE